jgi:hypothetical protein
MAVSISKWVEENVYNDLRWLIVAATTWQACRDGRSSASRDSMPPHLVVLAMDSSLVHGRSLLRFFCERAGVDGKARRRCGVIEPLDSPLFDEIGDELNTYLMHLGTGRITGHARSGDRVHLKYRVVEVVQEVDRLLNVMIGMLRPMSPHVADSFADARRRAIKNGANCATFFGIHPIL